LGKEEIVTGVRYSVIGIKGACQTRHPEPDSRRFGYLTV